MEIDNNIFWGLIVIPGKRYETEVEEPFRITKVNKIKIFKFQFSEIFSIFRLA